jgi:hypothetical protein
MDLEKLSAMDKWDIAEEFLQEDLTRLEDYTDIEITDDYSREDASDLARDYIESLSDELLNQMCIEIDRYENGLTDHIDWHKYRAK